MALWFSTAFFFEHFEVPNLWMVKPKMSGWSVAVYHKLLQLLLCCLQSSTCENGCTIYNSKFVLTTDMIVFGVRSSVHYEGYLFFYRALDRHLTYAVLFVV